MVKKYENILLNMRGKVIIFIFIILSIILLTFDYSTSADNVEMDSSISKADSLAKKVILVHGYNKSQEDMFVLKDNLIKLGYNVVLVDLPLTFKSIKDSTILFEKKVEEIISDMDNDEKIGLVGHSTGGLIIRNFLSNTDLEDRVERCVLIATPNQGSQLAIISARFLKGFNNIFKTLGSLHPDSVETLKLKDLTNVQIGAIAGNKNNLFLGKLLKEENDGRVQVSSVRYDGLKDFLIIPYGHKEIHYKVETAKLVDSFLRNGEFKR